MRCGTVGRAAGGGGVRGGGGLRGLVGCWRPWLWSFHWVEVGR